MHRSPRVDGVTRALAKRKRQLSRFRQNATRRDIPSTKVFGRLKDEYWLAPLGVRGLERVARHPGLTMLAGYRWRSVGREPYRLRCSCREDPE